MEQRMRLHGQDMEQRTSQNLKQEIAEVKQQNKNLRQDLGKVKQEGQDMRHQISEAETNTSLQETGEKLQNLRSEVNENRKQVQTTSRAREQEEMQRTVGNKLQEELQQFCDKISTSSQAHEKQLKVLSDKLEREVHMQAQNLNEARKAAPSLQAYHSWYRNFPSHLLEMFYIRYCTSGTPDGRFVALPRQTMVGGAALIFWQSHIRSQLSQELWDPHKEKSTEEHISEEDGRSRHLSSLMSDDEFTDLLISQLPVNYQRQFSDNIYRDVSELRYHLIRADQLERQTHVANSPRGCDRPRQNLAPPLYPPANQSEYNYQPGLTTTRIIRFSKTMQDNGRVNNFAYRGRSYFGQRWNRGSRNNDGNRYEPGYTRVGRRGGMTVGTLEHETSAPTMCKEEVGLMASEEVTLVASTEQGTLQMQTRQAGRFHTNQSHSTMPSTVQGVHNRNHERQTPSTFAERSEGLNPGSPPFQSPINVQQPWMPDVSVGQQTGGMPHNPTN
ncbi:hypothetical protein PR048_026881 [Dryococelus australis]|uniref:Uncharacterized protein n=1 Tax=Dryococelus australis TaxID=614101 RepID=A0ABQ9GML2_9NEOP|nr:hypothetical protein PR048_026881 [Dryococelus australis]